MSKGFAFGLVLALAGPALAQAPPAPDVPPGPARITGHVLRAEDGSPVAGAEVALYALTAEGVPGLRHTQSDAAGAFAFENVANDPAVGWLVGARFRGVAFPGGRVAFEAGKSEATVEVRVDEPISDPRAISVAALGLRLLREPSGLRVIETLTLENRGRNTYWAEPAARARAAPAFATALPRGALGFEMPLGVEPEGLAREGERLRWYGPVYPGSQELSWSYVVPAAGSATADAAPSRFAFEARVPERTARLEVLLADTSARLEGAGLRGPETADVEGRRVQRFTREAPPAGPLALVVSLPPARLAPGAVSVSEVRAVLRLDDAALDVTETHVLRVDGETHVLGTAAAPLLRIALPEGAERVRFGSDAPGLELAPHPEGGLALLGSVAPGEANVELGYQLPVGATAAARLERRFAARVPVLSIFVADTGRLAPRSERLHRRRPLRTNDLTYLHLEAFEVAPDEAVALELGLLPARAPGGRAFALGCVGVAALAAIWTLTRPLRARRGSERTEAERVVPAAREEREALYEAIRDLDHDFETGKLSAADHARLRDELRARALALLEAERAASEATGGAAQSEPEAPSCAACGTPALPAHRFCAQCGKPLAAGGEG